MQVKGYMRELGRDARAAARELARADTGAKDRALAAIAGEIRSHVKQILAANAKDVKQAKKAGRNLAFIDRLTMTEKSVQQMAEGVEQVAALADPVGAISERVRRPTGIEVARMRVPIGVIGIIYESRPNVTADAAALCLKSGNACILRGGSEALASNGVIAKCVQAGLKAAALPESAVQLVATADRAAVGELVTMREYVDIIVPRGGKDLIERLARESRIPMIKHLDGVCHVYIDDSADPGMAVRIADNAKTQRYSPCNTMETLLVHADAAARVLRPLATIYAAKGVDGVLAEVRSIDSDYVRRLYLREMQTLAAPFDGASLVRVLRLAGSLARHRTADPDTLADAQDRYVAVVEDATEDALVDVNALNLVDTHLEGLPFDKAGLVDDAEIGDVGLGGPAMEPGGCRLVQRSDG